MDFDKETQQRILRVAADRQDGKPVEEFDDQIVQVFDMHPEFEEAWKQGELATFPQEINGKIVNPFVHTVLHIIIDRQIDNGDPPAVVETFQRLKEEGMDPHEVLHAIIAAFAEVHFSNFRAGRPFDNLEYLSRLRLLASPQTP